jgi:hypothetical protein
MKFYTFSSKMVAACFAASLLILGACSSTPDTVSSKDPTVDFSQYKTYAFVADLATDKAQYQSLESTFLKTAVAQEMNRRGFTQVDTNPELAVNFAIDMQDKIRTRQVPTGGYGMGYDPYYDVYHDSWGASHSTQIDQYTEGMLDIDLIDVQGKKLIWQGTTKGRITKKVEENFEQALQEAVTEIFLQFPIQIAGPQ